MSNHFIPREYANTQFGATPSRLPEDEPAKKIDTFKAQGEDALRQAMMADPISRGFTRHPKIGDSTKRKDAARSEIKALVVEYMEVHGKSKAFDITAAIGRKDTDVRPALLELEAERKITISRGQRNCYICELVQ